MIAVSRENVERDVLLTGCRGGASFRWSMIRAEIEESRKPALMAVFHWDIVALTNGMFRHLIVSLKGCRSFRMDSILVVFQDGFDCVSVFARLYACEVDFESLVRLCPFQFLVAAEQTQLRDSARGLVQGQNPHH